MSFNNGSSEAKHCWQVRHCRLPKSVLHSASAERVRFRRRSERSQESPQPNIACTQRRLQVFAEKERRDANREREPQEQRATSPKFGALQHDPAGNVRRGLGASGGHIMPALLPIILTVSARPSRCLIRCRNLTSSVPGARPPQWACQGELLQRASMMKTMHGPSSSTSGPGTTQHSVAVSASILRGSIVRPATLNC